MVEFLTQEFMGIKLVFVARSVKNLEAVATLCRKGEAKASSNWILKSVGEVIV
ncbi:MAG: hypothetical protein KME05_05415 [Gloeocapsa sp. UFS-A4-WI-NPMV-4B04]|nr:hypothetical protein [Gloeocapsa sp. UFS-A4-WI-NPMV-4B04]